MASVRSRVPYVDTADDGSRARRGKRVKNKKCKESKEDQKERITALTRVYYLPRKCKFQPGSNVGRGARLKTKHEDVPVERHVKGWDVLPTHS